MIRLSSLMQFIYGQYSNFGIILNSKETTESGNNFLASNGEPKKKKKRNCYITVLLGIQYQQTL